MKILTTSVLTFLFFSNLFHSTTFAQKLAYNSISYEASASASTTKNTLNKLIRTIKDNPYDPNTYHLIGFIYYQRCLKYDILKDYVGGEVLADSAFFYFQKARDLMEDKDVKKNQEYYAGFLTARSTTGTTFTKANYPVITNDIKGMIDEIFQLKSKAKKVYTYFNRSFENYNNANAIYTDISQRFKSQEDMYLLADKSFFSDLDDMKAFYDSSILYFKNYKVALEDFPQKKYNQVFSVNKIKKFQKDGLTKANFFEENFELWDYSTWRNETKDFINTKISNLRERVQIYEEKLNTKLEQAKILKEPTGNLLTIDNEIVGSIKQYDPNTLLERLFNYKTAKVNFLDHLSFHPDSSTTLKDNTLSAVNIIGEATSCQELLGQITNNATTLAVAKWRDFFKKNYKSDLKSYVSQERRYLTSRIQNMNRQFGADLANAQSQFLIDTTQFLVFEEDTIPTFPISPNKSIEFENTQEGEYITIASVKDTSGVEFITGFQKFEEKHVPFVAAFNDTAIQWVTKLPIEKGELRGEPVSEGATIALVNGELFVNTYTFVAVPNEKGFGYNTIFKMDTLGAVQKQLPYQNTYYPRHLEKKGEDYFVVLKGYGSKLYGDQLEDVILLKLDQYGNEVWKKDIKLNGEVVRFTEFGTDFILLTNYKDIRFEGGRNYISVAESNETNYNISIASFTEAGEFQEVENFKHEQAMYAIDMIIGNLEEPNIGIIGYEGDPSDLFKSENIAKPVILILNNKLQRISENY